MNCVYKKLNFLTLALCEYAAVQIGTPYTSRHKIVHYEKRKINYTSGGYFWGSHEEACNFAKYLRKGIFMKILGSASSKSFWNIVKDFICSKGAFSNDNIIIEAPNDATLTIKRF